jgi:hypothetical protein
VPCSTKSLIGLDAIASLSSTAMMSTAALAADLVKCEQQCAQPWSWTVYTTVLPFTDCMILHPLLGLSACFLFSVVSTMVTTHHAYHNRRLHNGRRLHSGKVVVTLRDRGISSSAAVVLQSGQKRSFNILDMQNQTSGATWLCHFT